MQDSSLVVDIDTDDAVYLASGGLMECNLPRGLKSTPVTVRYNEGSEDFCAYVKSNGKDPLNFHHVALTVGRGFFKNLSPQNHVISNNGLRILFRYS